MQMSCQRPRERPGPDISCSQSYYHIKPPSVLDEPPSFLACGERYTVVVSPHMISYVYRGGSNEVTTLEMFLRFVISGSIEESPEMGPPSSNCESEGSEANIAAVKAGANVIVLTRDENTKGSIIRQLETATGEFGEYPFDEMPFEGNAGMAYYEGVVFIAAEAEVGKTFLFGFILHNGLRGYSVDAERRYEGEISFAREAHDLRVTIGEESFGVSVELSKKNLTNERSVACFPDAPEKTRNVCFKYR